MRPSEKILATPLAGNIGVRDYRRFLAHYEKPKDLEPFDFDGSPANTNSSPVL